MKSSFLWRYRIAIVGISFLITSLHLLSNGVRPTERLAKPEAIVMEALWPIQAASVRLVESGSRLFQDYIDLIGIQRENQKLKAQLAQFNAERVAAAELKAENQRLAELLNLRKALKLEGVAADVIGSDATGLSRTLILGQGSESGLKPGMAVLAREGVVGKIIATSPHASRVLLIDDHNSALDAFDQRSRARGIIAGVPDDGITLKYVDRADDLKPGDSLVTSGLDGIFARGLLIGYVNAVRHEGPGLFLSVDVNPAVNFRRLEQVLVITEQAPKMIEPAKS